MSKRDILIIALTLVLLILAAGLIGRVDTRQKDTETETVREAVKNAALTCYAVEGVFPADIAYLQENYGLLYDEDRYIIFYDAFAENLLPEIRVRERGQSK